MLYAIDFISSGKEVLGIARNASGLSFPSKNCDVSDFESLKDIAKEIKSNGKKVEALINAAGIAAMNLAITAPKATTEKNYKNKFNGHNLRDASLFSTDDKGKERVNY